MTLFLLLGAVTLLIVILNKNRLIILIGSQSYFVKKLSNTNWFQNKWFGGLFVFGINAFLFGTTLLVIFWLGLLEIPYLHLIIMVLAVVVSILFWLAVHNAWQSGKTERYIMGLIGSSFYLILSLFFIYNIINLGPDTPEQDNFMAFIGLVFATFVTSVAFLTCFLITGFSRRK